MPEGSFDENHRPEISTLDAQEESFEGIPKNRNKLETTARVLALIGGSGLLGGGCIATIGANPAVNNIHITKAGVNICGPSTIIGFIGILMLRAVKKRNNTTKTTPPAIVENENDDIVMNNDLSTEERRILVDAIRKTTY